jgi:hypothetical protein
MKPIVVALCLSTIAMSQTGSPAPQASMSDTSTSLGDVARKSRAAKPAASKVYTNDDLPSSGGLSVVGAQADAVPVADSVRDQASIEKRWHTAIAQQKAHIAELERDLAMAKQREARVTHYDPMKPNPAYQRYKAQVETLTKQVDEAKKQLADLQDQAHKAGANQSYD